MYVYVRACVCVCAWACGPPVGWSLARVNACRPRGRWECASYQRWYLEHVVDGLLLRGERREVRADGRGVVLDGEALVELEISVRHDGQTAPFHAHGSGGSGVRGLDNARLLLVGGRGAVGHERVLLDSELDAADRSNELSKWKQGGE